MYDYCINIYISIHTYKSVHGQALCYSGCAVVKLFQRKTDLMIRVKIYAVMAIRRLWLYARSLPGNFLKFILIFPDISVKF